MPRTRLIAIIGGRAINVRDAQTLRLAEAVGHELGLCGYGIVTGGEDGVGGAACRGCEAAGGPSVGLLKGTDDANADPHVTFVIPTSLDLARSVCLNWAGDAVIAFDGGFGTLFEIALALDTERPLILTGKQPLLKLDSVRVGSCRIVPGNDVAIVPDIMRALDELIGPPPGRSSIDGDAGTTPPAGAADRLSAP